MNALAKGEPGTLGYIDTIDRIEKQLAVAKIQGKRPKDVLNDEDYVFYRDDVLMRHAEAKQRLINATALEMELRRKAVDFLVDPGVTGTVRHELGEGYEAKTVTKLNYGWQKDKNDKLDKKAIDKALSDIESTGPEGAYIAENLVKWEPKLSLTEYKKLNAERKKIIDKVIRTTEAAPTLDIVAPKGK